MTLTCRLERSERSRGNERGGSNACGVKSNVLPQGFFVSLRMTTSIVMLSVSETSRGNETITDS